MKNIRKMFVLALVLGLLGIWDGRLALLQPGQKEPLAVFPYRVSMFPSRDQDALQKGIPYQNQPELSRLLEDFLS